jgi:hypothetical protein
MASNPAQGGLTAQERFRPGEIGELRQEADQMPPIDPGDVAVRASRGGRAVWRHANDEDAVGRRDGSPSVEMEQDMVVLEI